METNDYQIGGDHYQGDYQHWDFVCDLNLHYLLGCATKYVARWRKKNGLQDLRKAAHYIAKAEEQLHRIDYSNNNRLMLDRFCDQHIDRDAGIIRELCFGNYRCAQKLLAELLMDNDPACNPASKGYVDQD